MKIIAKDNFDRDNVSDILIAENVNEFNANHIAKLLNDSEGAMSPYYYKAVEDDYKLYDGSPV